MMTWLPVIMLQLCTYGPAGFTSGIPFVLCVTRFRNRVFDYSRRNAMSAASCLTTATDGDSHDRSAATTHGFFLCARQCHHDQDHHGPGRVGQSATRGTERRPLFLGVDRR